MIFSSTLLRHEIENRNLKTDHEESDVVGLAEQGARGEPVRAAVPDLPGLEGEVFPPLWGDSDRWAQNPAQGMEEEKILSKTTLQIFPTLGRVRIFYR